MKLFFVILLVATTSGYAQERRYGEKNGYDWKKINQLAISNFSSDDWENKQEWIDVIGRNYKIKYLQGIFDLTKYWSSMSSTLDSTYHYDYTPSINNTSPDQIASALDRFYSDYKNLGVLILDAITVVHMEITGSSAEQVEWFTRYYRSDADGRYKMTKEKYKIK